ncbi:MAG: hypothetical protein HY332_01700 [Chloroflexi bacterium]|nr:hypothetical protein [Chloroflexota bacterium]
MGPALLIAFIVNLFILGTIAADLFGYTDLGRWPRSGGAVAWRYIVLTDFLVVLALSVCFALPRVAQLTPSLPPATAATIHRLGSFAMNRVRSQRPSVNADQMKRRQVPR